MLIRELITVLYMRDQKASRDWGEHVGYVSDHDAHIIAFAQPTS